MSTATQSVTYGPQVTSTGEPYLESDWTQRDNFGTEAQAIAYAEFVHGKWAITPYRIVYEVPCRHNDFTERYVVEYVSDWALR